MPQTRRLHFLFTQICSPMFLNILWLWPWSTSWESYFLRKIGNIHKITGVWLKNSFWPYMAFGAVSVCCRSLPGVYQTFAHVPGSFQKQWKKLKTNISKHSRKSEERPATQTWWQQAVWDFAHYLYLQALINAHISCPLLTCRSTKQYPFWLKWPHGTSHGNPIFFGK